MPAKKSATKKLATKTQQQSTSPFKRLLQRTRASRKVQLLLIFIILFASVGVWKLYSSFAAECNNGICYNPTNPVSESGVASFYGTGTGSGKCAAIHITRGHTVQVRNNANQKTINCYVDDAGPWVAGRIIDIHTEDFKKLSNNNSTSAGLLNVTVTILSGPSLGSGGGSKQPPNTSSGVGRIQGYKTASKNTSSVNADPALNAVTIRWVDGGSSPTKSSKANPFFFHNVQKTHHRLVVENIPSGWRYVGFTMCYDTTNCHPLTPTGPGAHGSWQGNPNSVVPNMTNRSYADLWFHFERTGGGNATGSVPKACRAQYFSTANGGSKNQCVLYLQALLTRYGYSTKGVDGYFGNNTKNAVIAFQRPRNIAATGAVDPSSGIMAHLCWNPETHPDYRGRGVYNGSLSDFCTR